MLDKKLTTTNTKVEITLKMASLECDFRGPSSKFFQINFQGTPAHCLPDETSLDSKDSCDSARLTLLRQQVELAEQEMRRESAKAKRVEITLQAEQRARVDAEVRCEQVRNSHHQNHTIRNIRYSFMVFFLN